MNKKKGTAVIEKDNIDSFSEFLKTESILPAYLGEKEH